MLCATFAPSVQIITGVDGGFDTGVDDCFVNLYRLIFQIDFWNYFFKGVLLRGFVEECLLLHSTTTWSPLTPRPCLL